MTFEIENMRYTGVNPIPEWNKKVEFRTRAEMMAARKAEQIPDMSGKRAWLQTLYLNCLGTIRVYRR